MASADVPVRARRRYVGGELRCQGLSSPGGAIKGFPSPVVLEFLMSAYSCVEKSAPFTIAVCAFSFLTCAPDPMGLDCARFDPAVGLPPRFVPLPELHAWLRHHPKNMAAREAVWCEILTRARLGVPRWRIAAVVMVLPALVHRSGRYGPAGRRTGVGAAAIVRFLAAVDAGTLPAYDGSYR